MALRTIPIEFVSAAVELAAEMGVDLSAQLRAARIDLHGNMSRLTPEQVTGFTQATWHLTGDELFGLGSIPVPRGTFRVTCQTLIHSADLASAMQRMSDTMRVLSSVPPMTVVYGESTTRLEIAVTVNERIAGISVAAADAAKRLLTDFMMILIHRFAAWLIGRRVKPVAVEMPYLLDDPHLAKNYDGIFGVHVTFGAAVAALEIDNALLRAPIVQTEASLAEYLRESPNRLFSERDYDSTAATQVRRILESGTLGRRASTDDIADMLSVSVPQLRRLLRQDGTSINQLREEMLRDFAVAGLGRGESVDELSARLGFSEPSSFRRAFKRWTGSSPGAFRN